MKKIPTVGDVTKVLKALSKRSAELKAECAKTMKGTKIWLRSGL